MWPKAFFFKNDWIEICPFEEKKNTCKNKKQSNPCSFTTILPLNRILSKSYLQQELIWNKNACVKWHFFLKTHTLKLFSMILTIRISSLKITFLCVFLCFSLQEKCSISCFTFSVSFCNFLLFDEDHRRTWSPTEKYYILQTSVLNYLHM